MPVDIAKAVRKKVPMRLDALGTVTPIASVALKARVDTTITAVHFKDGAHVNKGDPLFTLDCRVMDAQIATTEGALARDKAQLTGAERDVTRYTELVGKGATPVTNLDNAKTQSDIFRAAIKGDTGLLDNLKVQRSFCDVTAPISGQISVANVKVGSFVRQADTMPMATINQMAPVYVSFTVPQKNLPAIRDALANKTATVQASLPGQTKRAQGQVSMIENTVDSATGMAMIRATMPNTDETAVAGHFGDGRDDAAHRGCGGGAVERGVGQPDRQFRFRDRRGQGQGSAHRGRTPGRRRDSREVRAQGRRDRRHRRPIAALERNAGQSARWQARRPAGQSGGYLKTTVRRGLRFKSITALAL